MRRRWFPTPYLHIYSIQSDNWSIRLPCSFPSYTPLISNHLKDKNAFDNGSYLIELCLVVGAPESDKEAEPASKSANPALPNLAINIGIQFYFLSETGESNRYRFF